MGGGGTEQHEDHSLIPLYTLTPTHSHTHLHPHTYPPSQFNPKSGPQLGGTEVTITGSNLGAERSDIQYVRIDGVNCTVIDYQPGVRYAALIHLRTFCAGIRSCLSVEDSKFFSLSSSPFLCTHVPPPPPSHPHILPLPASSVGLRQKSAVLSPITSPLSLTTLEVPPFHKNSSLIRYTLYTYCMCVCMYVYMYVCICMHVCMYLCIYMYVCMMHVCMYECMNV